MVYISYMELLFTIATLSIIIFSIVIHEVAHGSIAYALGDSTAKDSDRLNLNPINHLDPVGSFLVPLMLSILNLPVIGWAKPVPVDFYNLKDKRWGALKVSLAGPMANLLIALIFGLLIRTSFFSPELNFFFILVVLYNILLALFNLIPIPPLDGSHILFDILGNGFNWLKEFLTQYGFFILVFLVFLNNGRSLSFIFVFAQRIAEFFIGFPISSLI